MEARIIEFPLCTWKKLQSKRKSISPVGRRISELVTSPLYAIIYERNFENHEEKNHVNDGDTVKVSEIRSGEDGSLDFNGNFRTSVRLSPPLHRSPHYAESTQWRG